MNDTLDSQIIDAHARRDTGALIAHYATAAELADGQDEVAFFLTQAWIFALAAGDKRADEFHKKLVEMGRAD